MFRVSILAVLWSAVTYSFGFTMDRTAFVASTWDTAPSLDTYQRIFINPALNGKIQAMNMDKILQTADVKISTKLAENQTREKRSTTENSGTGINVVVLADVASTMKNDISESSERNTSTLVVPRNVILLLIDERSQDDKKENSWNDYKQKLPFAIEGFLQNCRDRIDTASLSLENTLAPKNTEKNCNCEDLLRSNIRELLIWARDKRGMATGAVSGSNFTIPPFLQYEDSNGVSTEFDGSNKSDAKLELRKNKRDSNDAWQVIDLSDRAKSVPSLLASEPKTESAMNYNDTWDIFDVFSKIRMAFFRSLLESLSRNDATSEDKFSPYRPFHFNSIKPTVTNLIGKTLKELKSISNDKGYMLIVAVPRNERIIALDLLRRETSPKDTLLVVTQICSADNKSIPFVAQGPNSQILQETKMIWELPIVIRKAISDCHSLECANRQKRDILIPHVPIHIFSQKLPARKRITRDKDAVEKLDEVNKFNDTNVKDTASTEETTTIDKEIQARSSTLPDTIPYSPVTALGVATSVVAVTVLISS